MSPYAPQKKSYFGSFTSAFYVDLLLSQPPPPLRKIAAILAEDIFKCISLNENDKIPIQISLKFVRSNESS